MGAEVLRSVLAYVPDDPSYHALLAITSPRDRHSDGIRSAQKPGRRLNINENFVPTSGIKGAAVHKRNAPDLEVLGSCRNSSEATRDSRGSDQ